MKPPESPVICVSHFFRASITGVPYTWRDHTAGIVQAKRLFGIPQQCKACETSGFDQQRRGIPEEGSVLTWVQVAWSKTLLKQNKWGKIGNTQTWIASDLDKQYKLSIGSTSTRNEIDMYIYVYIYISSSKNIFNWFRSQALNDIIHQQLNKRHN